MKTYVAVYHMWACLNNIRISHFLFSCHNTYGLFVRLNKHVQLEAENMNYDEV